MTLIGRGQVHVFERARGVRGAVVRFGEELLDGGAARSDPAGCSAAAAGARSSCPTASPTRWRR